MTVETEHTAIVDVEVPPDVAEKAAELANEENIAIEDAIDRLVDVVPGWDYPIEKVERRLGPN